MTEVVSGWVMALQGRDRFKFSELTEQIARAVHPRGSIGDDELDAVRTLAAIDIRKELQAAVDAGELQVLHPNTLGPHPLPIGRLLRDAIVLVDEWRRYLAHSRGLGLRLVPQHFLDEEADDADAKDMPLSTFISDRAALEWRSDFGDPPLSAAQRRLKVRETAQQFESLLSTAIEQGRLRVKRRAGRTDSATTTLPIDEYETALQVIGQLRVQRYAGYSSKSVGPARRHQAEIAAEEALLQRGFLTLVEATHIVASEGHTNDTYLRQRFEQAYLDGELPLYEHGSLLPLRRGEPPFAPLHYVFVDEFNQLLANWHFTARVTRKELPAPVLKRETAASQQDRLLFEILAGLGYDPHSMPPQRRGAKYEPKSLAKVEAAKSPAVFTPRAFEHAWTRCFKGKIKSAT